MSEAIIARGGRTITLLDPNRPKTLYTEIFNHNIIWTVPNGVVNNTVYVRLFGGGGGGGGYGNGGDGTGRDDGGYGAGGGGSRSGTFLGGNGGDGICIIQYYVYE